jgi:predicted transcriptional regulator
MMARKRTAGPTERELAILGVLWNRGPSTVREVHDALHQGAGTGYTTTLKLMQIMIEKGLLVREDDGCKRGEGVPPLRREAILASPHQPATPATAKKQGSDTCDPNRRGHVYRPALSEEKTQKQLVQDLLEKVFAGSAEKLVMRALAARKVSPKELKRIREMLDEIEGA